MHDMIADRWYIEEPFTVLKIRDPFINYLVDVNFEDFSDVPMKEHL